MISAFRRRLLLSQDSKREYLIIKVTRTYSSNYASNYIPYYIYHPDYCNGVYLLEDGLLKAITLTACTYEGLEDNTVAYHWQGTNGTDDTTYTYYVDVTGFSRLHYVGYSSSLSQTAANGVFYYSEIKVPSCITDLTVLRDEYRYSAFEYTCNLGSNLKKTVVDLSESGVTELPDASSMHNNNGLFYGFYANLNNLYNQEYGELELILPNNLVRIGSGSLLGINIRSITIPESCIWIGQQALESALELTSILAHNNIQYIGKYAFRNTSWWNNKTKGSAVILNNWLLGVNDWANRSNKNTKTVTFTSAVTRVSEGAFDNSEGVYSDLEIVSVTSGSHNIEYIGSRAFYNCVKLTEDLFYPGNKIRSIGYKAFYRLGASRTDGDPDLIYNSTTNAITGSYGGNTIYLDNCTVSEAAFQGSFIHILNIDTSTTSSAVSKLGQYCFSGITKLCKVNLGQLSSISTNTFGTTTSSGDTQYSGLSSKAIADKKNNTMFIPTYEMGTMLFSNPSYSGWKTLLSSTKCKFVLIETENQTLVDPEGSTTTTTTTTTTLPPGS